MISDQKILASARKTIDIESKAIADLKKQLDSDFLEVVKKLFPAKVVL